ncbi:MAG: hypothetical protein HQK65_16200 [Desulfamplus sp.]|nr:hypothetical protein [Desulfamplus sp.]
MAEKLDHGMLMKTLDYCYDKAVNGLPGLETAEEIAHSYMNDEGGINDKVNRS